MCCMEHRSLGSIDPGMSPIVYASPWTTLGSKNKVAGSKLVQTDGCFQRQQSVGDDETVLLAHGPLPEREAIYKRRGEVERRLPPVPSGSGNIPNSRNRLFQANLLSPDHKVA